MTGASPSQANPDGVDLGRVGPSRAGMLMDASVSVGFTYGYSRCPASRDATHSARLTEGGSYTSAYGAQLCDPSRGYTREPHSLVLRPSGDLTFRTYMQFSAYMCQNATVGRRFFTM